MKLCSQCGYCNGDYMETCARCNAPLSAQSMPDYNAGGYPASADVASAPNLNVNGGYPANMPQITHPQPQAYLQTAQSGFGAQGFGANYPDRGIAPPGMQSPYTQPQPYGMPGPPPYQGMPNQAPPPGMPDQMSQPGMLYQAPQPGMPNQMLQPDLQQNRAQPPFYPSAPHMSPPQYGNSPYPYAPQQAPSPELQRQLPLPGGELFEPLTDKNANTDDSFPVKPTKRSTVWIVLLVLMILLVMASGLIYYFHSNGMFPAEVSQKIDGVIKSVTGVFGDGVPNEGEEQEMYSTMLSRVRNTTGADDAQAKNIVDILIYQCGASDIHGISGYNEADVYKLNTPEGVCLIRLDPTAKTLLEVSTIETNPRYIYQNGSALDNIRNLCVNEEEIRLLKTHAQERMQGSLPEQSVSEYVFAIDDEWEFHKEQNWVAVYSYVAPNTEGGYNDRIPFYFEYEYNAESNQPAYTLKYAMIQGQSTGQRHFTDLTNPFDDNTGDSDDFAN